jgi:predicted nucleotidyltransferase
MRLTAEEVAGIKAAVMEVFGRSAVVRLFGSRVDDARKGGDIDLLVEVPTGRASFDDECDLLFAIEDRLGERKVDILLVEAGQPLDPMRRIALRDGVRL